LSLEARLKPDALDALFRTARTHNKWLDRPVPDALLREI
jgi:3-hydroxypropanoate dehydrogenase